MDADFREIFFVTRLGEYSSSKAVYVPLKMLFLIAEIYLFNYIMAQEYSGITLESKNLLMAEYLTWRGAKGVYFRDGSDGFEIFYGNTSILPNGEQFIIRDHTDFALPVDFTLFKLQDSTTIFGDTFLRLFEKYKESCVFSMELCFDVGGNKQSGIEK